jgi:hypothetical protein
MEHLIQWASLLVKKLPLIEKQLLNQRLRSNSNGGDTIITPSFSLEYTVINCCHKSNNATCYDWTPNIRVLVISPHYFSWPSFGSNIIPNSCHTQVIIFLSRRIGKKLTHRPQLQVLYLRVDSLQLNLPSIEKKKKIEGLRSNWTHSNTGEDMFPLHPNSDSNKNRKNLLKIQRNSIIN